MTKTTRNTAVLAAFVLTLSPAVSMAEIAQATPAMSAAVQSATPQLAPTG